MRPLLLKNRERGASEGDPVLSKEQIEAEPHSPITCPAAEQEQSVKRAAQDCPPEPGAREERRMGPQRSPGGVGWEGCFSERVHFQ